jgi:hypothetical protein
MVPSYIELRNGLLSGISALIAARDADLYNKENQPASSRKQKAVLWRLPTVERLLEAVQCQLSIQLQGLPAGSRVPKEVE